MNKLKEQSRKRGTVFNLDFVAPLPLKEDSIKGFINESKWEELYGNCKIIKEEKKES